MKLTILIMLVSVATSLHAQTTDAELSKIILEKDSLFWKGYNDCSLTGSAQLLSDDVEFYHDKGGITLGKDALVASLKNNLCSRTDWRLRREALPGTLRVFPMRKNDTLYGAILVGEHYFYITEKGKPEYRSGHAAFTHLWRKQNGVWIMTRIFSYDHGAPQKGISPKN